jgi:DNA-binding response OmpR family regulator
MVSKLVAESAEIGRFRAGTPIASTAHASMTLVARGTLVFVIDDDTEVRQSVVDLLLSEGYDARGLPRAETAWFEICSGAQPAAIVLDLWLPGAMSSGEFVRRLRASSAASTPILVLSGAPSVEQVESDVDAIAHKPMEATALVRALDGLVRRSAKNGAARRPRSSETDRPKARRRPATRASRS